MKEEVEGGGGKCLVKPYCYHSEHIAEGRVEESHWCRGGLKMVEVLSQEGREELEAMIKELGLKVWKVGKGH